MRSIPVFRLHRRVRARIPVVALALVSFGAVVATSACQGVAAVAATVNGDVITQRVVNDELKAILANKDYVAAVEQQQPVLGKGTGTFAVAFEDQVLTRQIILQLVHAEVVRRHVPITAAAIQQSAGNERTQIGNSQAGRPLWDGFAPSYQQLLARRSAEVSALQTVMSGPPPTDAAITTYYNANLAQQFSQNCVSHILVPTQAEAASLHDQIVNGADFAALARANSKDPGSAPNGGDLGCAPPGSYVPEFEAAVAALGVGALSAPVKTQFGFHIIKLTDRKVTPIDQARPQIVQRLQAQGAAAFQTFVRDSVAKAKVTVDAGYGTWQGAGAQAGVTPPNAPPAEVGGLPSLSPAGAPPGAPPGSGSGGGGGSQPSDTSQPSSQPPDTSQPSSPSPPASGGQNGGGSPTGSPSSP